MLLVLYRGAISTIERLAPTERALRWYSRSINISLLRSDRRCEPAFYKHLAPAERKQKGAANQAALLMHMGVSPALSIETSTSKMPVGQTNSSSEVQPARPALRRCAQLVQPS